MKMMAIFVGGIGGAVMGAGIDHSDPVLLCCSFALAVIAGALV